MKNTGPKTSHLKLNPPLGQTAVRCLPQNPNRFLSPKSVSRTPRSQHMIPQGEACHHQSIKALQDTPSIDKTSQGSCQLSMQDTWVRIWRIEGSRTPRGHAHGQGTSQGQGHLGGTPTDRASQRHGHLHLWTLDQGAHL